MRSINLFFVFSVALWGQFSSGVQPVTVNTIANAIYCADTSVSANTITCSTANTFPAYQAGQAVDVLLANSVTGATTININALGAKAVTYNGTTALISGIMTAGGTYRLQYDGTRFVLQGDVSQGALPAGSASEVQFRASATTFGGNSNIQVIDNGDASAKILAFGGFSEPALIGSCCDGFSNTEFA